MVYVLLELLEHGQRRPRSSSQTIAGMVREVQNEVVVQKAQDTIVVVMMCIANKVLMQKGRTRLAMIWQLQNKVFNAEDQGTTRRCEVAIPAMKYSCSKNDTTVVTL